jgi:hypothetical protein
VNTTPVSSESQSDIRSYHQTLAEAARLSPRRSRLQSLVAGNARGGSKGGMIPAVFVCLCFLGISPRSIGTLLHSPVSGALTFLLYLSHCVSFTGLSHARRRLAPPRP